MNPNTLHVANFLKCLFFVLGYHKRYPAAITMPTQPYIRTVVAVLAVGISLWVYGSTERVVSSLNLSYIRSPGPDWVTTMTGWPYLTHWKIEHASGLRRFEHLSTEYSNSTDAWWNDNQNAICWLVILFFTATRTFRHAGRRLSLRQITIGESLFTIAVVAMFLAIQGSQPFQPLWWLLLPISYGLTCIAMELMFTIKVGFAAMKQTILRPSRSKGASRTDNAG